MLSSRLCVNDVICKLSASGCGCHVAGIFVGVLMYADDLLLISSTCNDLRRMLRMVLDKPAVYNAVTFNTAVFSDTGIPRISTQLPYTKERGI